MNLDRRVLDDAKFGRGAVTRLSDFDRYCAKQGVSVDEVPAAFVDRLAQLSGRPIIGGACGRAAPGRGGT